MGRGCVDPITSVPYNPRKMIALARWLTGTARRAAAVLPWVTGIVPFVPFLPLLQFADSHRKRKHSSGRIPVSTRISVARRAVARYQDV